MRFPFLRSAPALAALALLALMSALLLVPKAANAQSEVRWTVSGTFADGGSFSGFFNLDAVNRTSSDWSISVTGGSTAALPPFTYTPANSTIRTNATINGHRIYSFRATSPSLRFLSLPFDPDLTNAGGVSSIYVSPGNSTEFTFDPSFASRLITGGTATGVLDPATLIGNLIDLVESYGLSGGIENSFVVKLDAALSALAAEDTDAAIAGLQDFINHAQAQSGKKLTVGQAQALIEAAEAIIAQLSGS
jgi:hypothetical protein